MATIHWCIYRDSSGASHTRGNGKPRRKTCAYCGGTLITQHGEWGVFVHSSFPNAGPSGDRYRRADAVSIHNTQSAADRVIAADTTNSLVVRWLSE